MNSLLITLITGLFFLFGSLIAIFSKKNKSLISFSIGISFVVLIILLFIDILPECFELITEYRFLTIGGGIMVGISILILLDKLVPHHNHNDKHHHHNLSHIGVMSAVALIIHNIIEGMGIYGVANTDIKMGVLYALGVSLHNIPFGIEITAMLNETKNKIKMWIYIFLLTFSTFFGGLLVYLFDNLLSDFVLGSLLSITMGMIIYIVLFELFPILRKSFNKYSLYGILIGILLMLIGMVI